MTIKAKLFSPQRLKGIVMSLGAIYLGLLLPMTLMQRHLLYWPVRISVAEEKKEATESGLTPWLNRSGEIIGWQALNSPVSTTNVLIVHGTDGCALDRAMHALLIRRATGMNVYILEYPGYGAREGSPSEKTFMAAGDDAWENLPHQATLYIVSESLGAGVAAHLAGRHPAEVSGLVMFVPYDRLTSVAQHHLPIFPAAFLLWDRFAPADDLAKYPGPVKYVVAGSDWVIPPQSGQKLYDGFKGPKSLQIIPGAGHADTMNQSIEWWEAAFGFLQSRGMAAESPGSGR
jgi:pimeloyl-ACP methyl ester carboxylesterase